MPTSSSVLRETHLVRVLMSVGFKHARAVAFERWLDDKHPIGVSGAYLASCFDCYRRQGADVSVPPESRSSEPNPHSAANGRRDLFDVQSAEFRAITHGK